MPNSFEWHFSESFPYLIWDKEDCKQGSSNERILTQLWRWELGAYSKKYTEMKHGTLFKKKKKTYSKSNWKYILKQRGKSISDSWGLIFYSFSCLKTIVSGVGGGIYLGQNVASTFEIRFEVKEKNSDIWGKCFRKNHTVSQSFDGDSDLLNISTVHTVSQQYTEDRYTISPKPKIAYTSTTLSAETGAQWIRAMFLRSNDEISEWSPHSQLRAQTRH